METSRVYELLLNAWAQRPRYINSCGGTRSGKTYSILQLLIQLAMTDRKPTITSVVSETLPHLKRGAIRDFQQILGDSFSEDNWNKSELIYTFPTGSIIEFFSADAPAKVHGPARDRLFINEAQNISHDVARQLFVRTRGRIIFDYNPTHSFWANEIYELRPDCQTIRTTYKDNNFLTPEQVREIEANRNDKNWWRVYGQGLVGELEGLIFEFEMVDELRDPDGLIETYGMDFGFTNDPTTLLHCLIDNRKREIWVDEVCYKTGMLNSDIINLLRSKSIQRNVPIYADCAEPKTIEEIYRAGYNCKPCYKATRKAEQIQSVKGYRLLVTKGSLNTITELRGYVWDKDKTGKLLNEPIPFNDHAMDALRYGTFIHLSNPNHGKYRIHA